MEPAYFEKLPSNNLGAKYLDTKQMEANFPDYTNLLDRIEHQRELAKYVASFGNSAGCSTAAAIGAISLRRFPQMYDNVFAILGGRGSGKSSVIQSLHEQMQNGEDNFDIVFPIIVPELISDPHCSILGWIMATAEEVIDSIEEQFRQLEREQGGRWVCDNMHCDPLSFFKDCHLQRNNKLRENYEALKRDCIPDYSFTSDFSYEDAVGIQVNLSQKQYDLAKNLNTFWNDVTTYWKNLKILQAKKERRNLSKVKTPLIILMFDDVDLVPERSLELLNSTFQYFTNPNIVLILTAAEKVLNQVIWTKMLERMIGSNYKSLFTDFYTRAGRQERAAQKTSLESIDRMAGEYYDKVVPPANRYSLRRYFTIAERKRYRYASIGQSVWLPEETVSIELEDFLSGQIKDLEDSTGTSTSLCDPAGKIRDVYLLMFGDKSRNIANGCLAILNCVARLKQCLSLGMGSTAWQTVYNALRQLLEILISSNGMTKEPPLNYGSLFYQTGKTGEVKINYNYIWEIYEKQRELIEDKYTVSTVEAVEWMEDIDKRNEASLRLGQEELKSLQKQVSILLVMLNFADGLKAAVSGKLMDKTHGSKDGEDGICEIASMINSAAYSQLIDRKIAGDWSWLSLFPKKLSIDDFLLRFPYALEHVDRYAKFDPFDVVKTQEYLIDIFYKCSVNCDKKPRTKKRSSIEELIRNGNCPPGTLLASEITNEPEWVKTVMAMLFLRYSGITEVDSSFLNFSRESRNILEIFSFSGHLNRKIKEGLIAFLKGDLSGSTLKKTVDKLFSNLDKMAKQIGKSVAEKTDPPEKIINVLNEFKNKESCSLSVLYNWYHTNIEESDRQQVFKYFMAYRLASNTPMTTEAFADWLIRLVENDIDMVGSYLKNQSCMELTDDTYGKILDLLNDIPVATDELRTARRACLNESEKSKKAFEPSKPSETRAHSDTFDGDGSSANDSTAKEAVMYPLNNLLNYLLILGRETGHRQVYEPHLGYWFSELVRGYFDLSTLLDPTIAADESKEKNKAADESGEENKAADESEEKHKNKFDTLWAHDHNLSANSMIILVLDITERLLPTYFAAKLLRKNVRDLYSSAPSSMQYPLIENVSARVRATYQDLLDEKEDKDLFKMMSEVRDQVADLYIEYLEGNRNE